ncbi:hypothetical protein IV82_GL000594 [Pediococcus acidilactici]|nr:hypothetical protein IV82_GL000594 [Pediococcus acidilactici]
MTSSPAFKSSPLTSSVQFPSASIVTGFEVSPLGKVTVTVAPGFPVPVIVVAPSIIPLMTGGAVRSCTI